MFKWIAKFAGVLAVIHPITAQEALSTNEEPVTAPEAATPVIPATMPAPPPPPPRVSPPPAPPAPAVNPAVAAARRLEEERAMTSQQLHRDFHDACRHFDKTNIEALLLRGANVDDVTASGPSWSVLAEAAVNRNTELALYLLSKRASPDVEDNRGRTPLFHAVRYNLGSVVTEMIKTAKNLQSSDGDGVDMLTRAVWQEQTDIAKTLLAAGASSPEAAKHAASSTILELRKMFGHSETMPSPAPVASPAATPSATPAAASSSSSLYAGA